jgi:spermidine synthase
MESARQVSQNKASEPYDAIIWDLYVGPLVHGGAQDKLYGDKAIRVNFGALKPGGVFAVWGEEQSPAYEARLKKAGFEASTLVTKGGGVRHAVFIGVKPKAAAQP